MSYNILIADDELDIVKMLAGFFSGKGYNVLTAANGIDTIKQAERKPDIILLDIICRDWTDYLFVNAYAIMYRVLFCS